MTIRTFEEIKLRLAITGFGFPVKNFSYSASLHSGDNIAPSNVGTKHLGIGKWWFSVKPLMDMNDNISKSMSYESSSALSVQQGTYY